MSVRQSLVVPYEGLNQVHSICAPDAARTVGGSALHGFVPRIGPDTLVSTSTTPFDAFLQWFALLISLIHT
ncbi:hypothetical protein [Pasteuria penetrans]|uniref:hypothetical protein n=1 Tax=Pasteuria penetrans TaxID=86005 RepID=UPI0011EFEF1C|nr:hypothetical protein [Pasteuria penetrans]